MAIIKIDEHSYTTQRNCIEALWAYLEYEHGAKIEEVLENEVNLRAFSIEGKKLPKGNVQIQATVKLLDKSIKDVLVVDIILPEQGKIPFKE